MRNSKDKFKTKNLKEERGIKYYWRVEGVEPTTETINDLSYPLSREIYTYVNNASLKDKPQVADYTRFMNENAAALSEEVGYVGMEQARYDENAKMIDEIAGE